MKRNRLIAMVLALAMMLSLAACATTPSDTETTSAPAGTSTPSEPISTTQQTEPQSTLPEGLNKDIYTDEDWEILTAKHEKPVNITMWIPNSETSSMGVGIQTLADAFNAEQEQKIRANPAPSTRNSRPLFWLAITPLFLR